MSNPMDHPAFALAESLAPLPDSRETATTATWVRHYAALAMAAHAAFRDAIRTLRPDPVPGSRPDLDYLITVAVAATAATATLTATPEGIGELLWDLTPELGDLNGEYIDWLADVLAGVGINPAELYTDFNAADFQPAVLPSLT